MQVSWIEPEQLRDLVGQLQGTPAGGAAAWELHTLPVPAPGQPAALAADDRPLWLGDVPLPAPAAPAPVSPPADLGREMFSPAALADEFPRPTQESQAPPEELERIRHKLQAIRERAIEAGLLAHVQPAEPAPAPAPVEWTPAAEPAPILRAEPPTASPYSFAEPEVPAAAVSVVQESRIEAPEACSFEVPLASLAERINAFAVWATRRMNTIEMFIVDDHGDVLWGEHAQAGLVVSATMACKAAARSSALGASELMGVIEQPITEGRSLIIVPCRTSYGPLSITLIRDRSLTTDEAILLREALLAAVEAQLPPPDNSTALD